jgi:aryl-alcohol dehydrogenase-like predicted oxidoreductase
VFNPTGNKGPNDRGASRVHVMDGVKASLKRLGTDYIDLYQIHGIDTVTPMEEIVRAFEDLTRQGHIRYFGVSNWPAWLVMKALGTADRLNAARLVSLQAYYTVAGRDLERDIAPMLAAEKVGLMVWSPLAGGLLSGKYDREGKGPQGARRVSFDFPPVNRDRLFDCVDVMRGIAKAHGTSVAGVAIAWLLHKPFVTTVIIGAKNSEQLDANLAATKIRLTADDLAKLDEVSALPPEYPGWMIERLGANRLPEGQG